MKNANNISERAPMAVSQLQIVQQVLLSWQLQTSAVQVQQFPLTTAKPYKHLVHRPVYWEHYRQYVPQLVQLEPIQPHNVPSKQQPVQHYEHRQGEVQVSQRLMHAQQTPLQRQQPVEQATQTPSGVQVEQGSVQTAHVLVEDSEQLVLQVTQETVLVHSAQLAIQAVQEVPVRQYPLAQTVQVVQLVQVAQARGHALQVEPDRKQASWQVVHVVAPLQFMQGSEQAMQLGELRQQVSAHAVHVYPLENEQDEHPAGQGQHPFETKQQ